MGTISNYYFPGGEITASSYKAFFDSLECPLITTNVENNTLYVNVDNAYVLYFSIDPYGSQMGYILRGESHDLETININNAQRIVVCFSDDVFYIQHNQEYYDGRRMLSIYERVDDKRLVANIAPGGLDTHAWYSIEDVTFLCLENNLYYKHRSRLKYAQKQDYIDYTVDNLICGDTITDIVDPNFVSCSNITANRVLTFNSTNFYAMSSNILFPLD